jgi:hypothetical protein
VGGNAGAIFLRNKVHGVGSSSRRGAQSHFSQDRCALLLAEMVEEIGKNDEIVSTAPIDLERAPGNHLEAFGDASLPRVRGRQLENARPIHGTYNRSGERLDAIEAVSGRDVEDLARRPVRTRKISGHTLGGEARAWTRRLGESEPDRMVGREICKARRAAGPQVGNRIVEHEAQNLRRGIEGAA